MVWPLFLALFLAVLGDTDLANIKTRIEASNKIDTNSIGSYLEGHLNSSLRTGSVTLYNCSFSLTNDLLTVNCRSYFWSSPAVVEWNFWKVSGVVNMAYSFEYFGTLPSLIATITRDKTPTYLSEAHSHNGNWLVEFATATGAPKNIPMGVTLSASVGLSGSLLTQFLRILPTGSDSVQGRLFVPIFGGNTPFSLSLDVDADAPLSKHITMTDLSLLITNGPSNTVINANMKFQVGVMDQKNNLESVAFQVSTELNQGEITLTGSLIGQWENPFKVKWLNITSMDVALTLGSDPNFLVKKATASVEWHNAPIDVSLQISGASFNQVLIVASKIPLSHKVSEIFKSITGDLEGKLDQINVDGTATIAIATYNAPGYREGFTLLVDATTTKGESIETAVSKLDPNAPESLVYTFTMYLPIFTNVAVDLTLNEANPFQVNKKVICDSFTITLNLGGAATEFKIDAVLQILLHDGQNLKTDTVVDLSQSTGLEFKGTTLGPWKQPFGMKWLTSLNAGASVDIKLEGEEIHFGLHGIGALKWVPGSQVGLDVVLTGGELDQFEFALTNVPLKDSVLVDIIHDLTGRSIKVVESMHPTGVGSIVIANFQNPQGPVGFTLSAKVQVQNDGSDLYKALSLFRKDVNTLTFDLSLNIQVFSTPASVTFDLTEEGSFKLNHRITVNRYGLYVIASETPSIAISTNLDIAFKQETLNFDVSATWQVTSEIQFNGKMTGDWVHPFNQKWLTITGVGLSFDISYTQGLSSFDISGEGNFHWGTDTGSAAISLTTSDNFMDDTLSCQIKNQWTIKSICDSIAGSAVDKLIAGLETKENLEIDFSLSTSSGVTLSLVGSVTGDLKSQWTKYRYWLPNHPGDSFTFAINIPVFSSNPLDVTLSYSEVENIKMNKHVNLTQYSFALATAPFQVSLDAQLVGEFHNNPPLKFETTGKFSVDAGIVLSGAMIGTWPNAFGFKGFDLSNVIAEIGFSPAACAYGCISDFGLGASFNVGSTAVTWDGNVAFPDIWDIYLAGSISKNSPHQQMEVLDVAQKWNEINPNNKVDDHLIPGGWAMQKASFFLAGADGQFGPIHYTKGFGISAWLEIISMDVFFSLNCTGDSFTCDFAFDVTMDIHTITKMIEHEILLMYPGMDLRNNATWTVFKVESVELTQWSQKNSANNLHPRWQWEMTVFNKKKHLDFNVRQYELNTSFHKFFVQWLKHLF